MLADVLIEKRAASRDGVLTLDEAVRGGLSPRQVQHRIRTGEWTKLYPRVYLVDRRDPDQLVSHIHPCRHLRYRENPGAGRSEWGILRGMSIRRRQTRTS